MYSRQRPCPPGTQAYTIRPGDTFYSLARRYNTTVQAIIAANPGVNPNFLFVGQRICIPVAQPVPQCPEGNPYVIRPGDTLYSIARFYNISVDDLIEANPGIIPEALQVGQVICIPVATPPVTCPPGSIIYVVRPGDTFYSIARRFNVPLQSLLRANPGVNPQALLVGQQICVPTF